MENQIKINSMSKGSQIKQMTNVLIEILKRRNEKNLKTHEDNLNELQKIKLINDKIIEYKTQKVDIKEKDMKEELIVRTKTLYNTLESKYNNSIQTEKRLIKESFHRALSKGLENVMGEVLFIDNIRRAKHKNQKIQV
jgi:hypothetical protein